MTEEEKRKISAGYLGECWAGFSSPPAPPKVPDSKLLPIRFEKYRPKAIKQEIHQSKAQDAANSRALKAHLDAKKAADAALKAQPANITDTELNEIFGFANGEEPA